jgi:hypothetical protein
MVEIIQIKKEVPVDPMEELNIAIEAIKELFHGDADLVRPGAAAHNVDVTEGNMITPLSEGNYNARIPDGLPEEIEAIKKAGTIAFICEDFRQSHKAAQQFKADVVFASAGGVVQPDKIRREAMVNLAVAMHRVNPQAKFKFAFHTEVCGGAKKFTGGEGGTMDTIYKKYGVEGELAEMTKYAKQFVAAALRAHLPDDRIELHTVHLHKGRSPEGLSHRVKEIRRIAHT